jgi:hypothetical protein
LINKQKPFQRLRTFERQMMNNKYPILKKEP